MSTTKYTLDKLKKIIAQVNQLMNKTDKEAEDKKDRGIAYLKTYLDQIKGFEQNDIIISLKEYFSLSKEFYIKYGDDLIEKLWGLYNENEFTMGDYKEKELYDYFLWLFFCNNQLLIEYLQKEIINFNIQSKEISVNFDKIKQEISSDNILTQNFLIDLIIMMIYSITAIQGFYTTISALLMMVNSNVTKFYKILSLFGLCYWKLEKKQDFINSLLFISGGVMRDLARSYLKTKGILNENLTYHKCSNKKKHQSNFFPASTLIERDCNYLEFHFLPSMQKFLEMIMKDFTIDSYWDDNKSLIDSLSQSINNTEEIFSKIPVIVKVEHYIMLFLSDFIFFFVSNFTSMTNKCVFNSNYSGFKEFIVFALDFYTKSNRNLFELFNYSNDKRRLLEMNCDKTEYELKDSFNHYGICFLMLFSLNGEFKSKLFPSYLPLIVDVSNWSSAFEDILVYLLTTENEAENKYSSNYIDLTKQILYLLHSNQLLSKSDLSIKKIKELFKNADLTSLEAVSSYLS